MGTDQPKFVEQMEPDVRIDEQLRGEAQGQPPQGRQAQSQVEEEWSHEGAQKQ